VYLHSYSYDNLVDDNKRGFGYGCHVVALVPSSMKEAIISIRGTAALRQTTSLNAAEVPASQFGSNQGPESTKERRPCNGWAPRQGLEGSGSATRPTPATSTGADRNG
jgi:hypothetical protein